MLLHVISMCGNCSNTKDSFQETVDRGFDNSNSEWISFDFIAKPHWSYSVG